MTDVRKCGIMIDIMETGEKIMNKIVERIARLRALPAANILQDLPVLPAQR